MEPGLEFLDLGGGVTTWYSGHDNSTLARTVLSRIDKGGPEHIFPDILDRHCPEVRAQLDEVTWPSSRIKDDGPKNKRSRRSKLVDEHSSDSDCTTTEPLDSDTDFVAENMNLTLDAIFKSSAILSASNAYQEGDESRCSVHGKDCRVRPPRAKRARHRTHYLTGGMSCLDFSFIGKGAGLGGDSTLPCLSFLGTFQADDIDLGALECAPAWDPQVFTGSRVASTHTLHPCVPRPCPSLFGWAFVRDRFYGIVVKTTVKSQSLGTRSCNPSCSHQP